MRYITVKDIVQVVSSEFGIPEDVLTSKVKTRPVTRARHIAIYLSCKLSWQSKNDIARIFNQCDHASVYHGQNKITGLLLDGNKEITKQIGILTQKLGVKV